MTHIAKEKDGRTSWADISVSCALRRREIPLKTMKGLYGWKVDGASRNGSQLNAGYIKAIHQRDPLPVTFHYITIQQQKEIHQEFQAMNESQVSRKLWPPPNASASELDYDAQVACFIAKDKQWRRAQRESHEPPC